MQGIINVQLASQACDQQHRWSTPSNGDIFMALPHASTGWCHLVLTLLTGIAQSHVVQAAQPHLQGSSLLLQSITTGPQLCKLSCLLAELLAELCQACCGIGIHFCCGLQTVENESESNACVQIGGIILDKKGCNLMEPGCLAPSCTPTTNRYAVIPTNVHRHVRDISIAMCDARMKLSQVAISFEGSQTGSLVVVPVVMLLIQEDNS